MEAVMGGSGSSGGVPNFGSGGRQGDDPCNLRFRVPLFGPVPAVISTMSVGDILDIHLITQNQTASVTAVTQSSGQVAGTIVGVRQLGDLVNCLNSGYAYTGEVMSIVGATVTILIERV